MLTKTRQTEELKYQLVALQAFFKAPDSILRIWKMLLGNMPAKLGLASIFLGMSEPKVLQKRDEMLDLW